MELKEIDKSKVSFFKQINIDPLGMICKYDDNYIRIIHTSKTNFFRKLVKSGLLDKLVELGYLAKYKISDMTYDGKMIVIQEKIEPVNNYCCQQWTFEMQKDVALLVLKINRICNEYGYELMDCHQYNVMFDGARPVYIDIGSIGKWNGKSWAAKQEFFTSYYYPLTFWSRGYIELALANLNLHWDVVRSNSYEHLSEIYNAIINPQAESGHLDRAENLENAINELKLEDSNFLWEGYQNDFWDRPLGKRFEREIEWIKSKPDIKSMTELGANQGYFSFQVAHMTSIGKIIATDFERTALDKCYIKLKEDEAAGSKITPLFMDFCTASEAMLNDMAGDCTVANALTHHLLLTDKMLIDALVERLFLVTKKYLIVEFMPRGMGFGTRVPKWYSLEWFMKHLSKKFEIETTEETEFGRIQIYAIKKTEVSNG